MLTRRALLSVPVLSACRGRRQRVIGVVPKATSHLFFMAVQAGVNRAATELNVEVLWNGPNEETDHARQIQVVDSMVVRHVDAMAISATDERAIAGCVQRAIDAGIPVTIFDSGVDVQGYIAWVATDNHGAGCTAARLIADLCGKRGNVGMVMHKPGGTSTGLRETGFEETIRKEFPEVKIVARQYGMADAAKARAAAENMLTAHPTLDAIFASSEASSLGSIQAITSRHRSGKTKLITFDTSDSHIEALEKGTIDIMLVQDSFRMGHEAVRTLVVKLEGGTPDKRLDIPARIVRKQDLQSEDVRNLLKPKLG